MFYWIFVLVLVLFIVVLLRVIANHGSVLAERDAEIKAHEIKHELESILWSHLVIDISIWMAEENYKHIFAAFKDCLDKRHKLYMTSEQFDTLVNFKRLDKDAAAAARRAINRVNKFQKAGKLIVLNVTTKVDRTADANRVIIDELLAMSKDARRDAAILFTDNKEQMVRARGKADVQNKIEVITGTDLLDKCTEYCNCRRSKIDYDLF